MWSVEGLFTTLDKKLHVLQLNYLMPFKNFWNLLHVNMFVKNTFSVARLVSCKIRTFMHIHK